MRDFAGIVLSIGVLLCLSTTSWATTYDFDVKKDHWGLLEWDSILISENWTAPICLDFSGDPDYSPGAGISEAWLELDFTNDTRDDYYSITFWWNGKTIYLSDYREFVEVQFEDGANQWIGEVDNGQHTIGVNTTILDDGELLLRLRARNYAHSGTAWLDHARLYGYLDPSPAPPAVPEPLTAMALIFSGAGLGSYIKKRRRP
jgi:hypothetical protein